MVDKLPKTRRRMRIAALVLAGIAAALGVSGYILLDANRYKPQMESFLARRTGLDIDLGIVEWGVLPTLNASIRSATVTADGWHAEIRGITAEGDLTALSGKRVVVRAIHAESLVVALPDAPRDWLQVYRDIAQAFRPRSTSGGSGFKAQTIGPITVDRVELISNDFSDAILAGRVFVSDVMAPEIQINLDGVSPAGGIESRVRAAATLARVRGQGLTGISVSGSVEELDLNGFVPEVPPALFTASLETTSTDPKNLGIAIEGGLDGRDHAVLDGDLSAMFWYTPEHVSVNAIHYQAPGAQLQADLTRHRAGELAVEVARFSLEGDALDAFLDQVRRDSVYLTAADGAHLTAEDVTFGVRADGTQEFSQGSLDFAGLAVHDSTGHAYETNIRGRGSMKGRHITVDSIEGDHSRFSGTFEPDIEAGTVTYRGEGVFRLSHEILPSRITERYTPEANLPIRVTNIHGSYTRGERPGQTLGFDANIDPGNVRLTVADVDSILQVDNGSLRFENGVLNIALALQSEEFGAASATGRYRIDDRSIEGTVEADIPLVLPNFIPGIGPESMYASILNQFGRTALNLSTTVPRSSYDTIGVDIVHSAEPPLDGRVEFSRSRDGGLRLGNMTAAGTIEAASLDNRLKGPFVIEGPLDIEFDRDAGTEVFRVDIDALETSVRFGQRIEKRPQSPLAIVVSGAAPRSRWRADRLDIACFSQSIPIKFEDGGLVLEPTSLDLDAMSALAPEGGFLKGNATLGIDTRDDSYFFGFDNASFRLEEDLGLDALDGEVRVIGSGLGESELRMRNPAGEAAIAWTNTAEGWHGSLHGSFLDVDVLQRILEAVGRASGNEPVHPEDARTGGPPQFPLNGSLEVRLDTVKYRNARFDGVTGNGRGTPESIRFPSLRAAAYGGTIDGQFELIAGSPGTIQSAMGFENVDTKLLDDLYFEGERGFRGAATGEIHFSAPMGAVADMIAAGNGSGSVTAVDGTFGQAGWATRLLGVLKTVEIFSLRSPWRNEGLSYDTCSGSFTLVDGRATLSDTSLYNNAYKMSATGFVDFARNETDVRIAVNLFQSINRVARHIPIVRNIAGITTERIAVPVSVTGPPSDLQFSVGSPTEVKSEN